MDTPLISVIIPTFNRANYVLKAIRSALEQDYSKIEVLVIDDGSTDGTRKQIEESFGEELRSNGRLRYFWQTNQGVSAARNYGLTKAQGTLVAFLDSDDLWIPEKLAIQAEVLQKLPDVGMVWSDMDAIAPTGEVLCRNYLRKMYRAYHWAGNSQQLFTLHTETSSGVPIHWGDIFSEMVLGNLVHTSTVLIRKSRQEKVGFFKLDLQKGGEDYEFHLRTCMEGPVAFIETSTTLYRIGLPDALTRSENNLAMASAYLETLIENLAYYADRIRVPLRTQKLCLAEAYAWFGREQLIWGDSRAARQSLEQSFWTSPWPPRQIKYWLATWLPRPIRERIIKIKRVTGRVFSRAKPDKRC